MADISPESTSLDRVSEYQGVRVKFTPILASDESLVSLIITEFIPNDGIDVEEDSFSGEYRNTFDYGTNRLLIRRDDDFTHLESWDNIEQPNKTDVYLWRAPTGSRYYRYTVELKYKIKETGTGGGGSYDGEVKTLVKEYTQEVYPNWDIYAQKLKKQLKIRSETWLE